MGRHTKGRRKKDERGGPSIWFFVALAIGIALLVWAAITVARTPVQVPEKPKTTTELRLELQALSSKLLAPSCKLQAASSKLQALSS